MEAVLHVVVQALLQALMLVAGASAAMMPTSNTAILSGRKIGAGNQYCQPLMQQKNVNLDALSGYWYAVEMLAHREEDYQPGNSYQEITMCPTMFITQIDNTSDIRLLWQETLGQIEFRFRVVDEKDRGFWMSVGNQNGSLTANDMYPYRQFAGTVQVMRAVASDMVLTFCSPGTAHYSMVMSRNKTMTDQQLHHINTMLTERGLQLSHTRVACRGGATASATHLGAAALLVLTSVLLLNKRDRHLFT